MAAILIDAGPMAALFDRRDSRFGDCRDVVANYLSENFVTTIACLTEALFLLGRKVGPRAQDELLNWLEVGYIEIVEISQSDFPRLRTLMAKYADLPMAFADASLVLTAEKSGTNRIFTFDSHFRVYRTDNLDHFDVLP